jgi:hypothetical protein
MGRSDVRSFGHYDDLRRTADAPGAARRAGATTGATAAAASATRATVAADAARCRAATTTSAADGTQQTSGGRACRPSATRGSTSRATRIIYACDDIYLAADGRRSSATPSARRAALRLALRRI